MALARQQKLLPLEAIVVQAVALDDYNQLITLETALAGGILVLADDSVVRDTAGHGRGYATGPHSESAARVEIYLDAPLSRSGEQAASLRQLLAEAGLAGGVQAVPVPERLLLKHAGPVASSDGAVIERALQPLDLAGQIILNLQPAIPLEILS